MSLAPQFPVEARVKDASPLMMYMLIVYETAALIFAVYNFADVIIM